MISKFKWTDLEENLTNYERLMYVLKDSMAPLEIRTLFARLLY